MRWGLRFAMRLLGREMVEEDWVLPPERMAQIIGLFLVTFSLSGIGLYLLIISLTSYSPGYMPLAAGTYTLAGVIGMFAIFAPAGIGVREGFMVGLLQFTMPLEMAIRAASDAGEPPAAGNGPAAQLFAGLAQRVDDWLKG
ncbi:MAG: hypothetical protein IH998_07790 [Proteobacteria bacterium]|nr:hypothetical protein [Pseudomonadota bacterium]